jgi:hypothetical protein
MYSTDQKAESIYQKAFNNPSYSYLNNCYKTSTWYQSRIVKTLYHHIPISLINTTLIARSPIPVGTKLQLAARRPISEKSISQHTSITPYQQIHIASDQYQCSNCSY